MGMRHFFNGEFSALKSTGAAVISSICNSIQDEDNKSYFTIIEAGAYNIRFTVFNILFHIGLELKTDCEQTRSGKICVYRVHKPETEKDAERLEPFLLDSIGGTNTNEFEIKWFQGGYKVMGGGKKNYTPELEGKSFGEYFIRVFPEVLVETKMQIPL
jgi:hypothetical protein